MELYRPVQYRIQLYLIRFTSVRLWLFCANSTFNFDADDGTNDTHDTQIQMSELVIKFLGYIFEYGVPDNGVEDVAARQ